MAILTSAGRVTLAKALRDLPIYLAWGSGAVAWDEDTPPESQQSNALTHLLGYRKARRVAFCEPSDGGEIDVPNGQFALSDTPTQHLYCQFTYDFEDALGETIREVGLMVGTQAKSDIPPGKYYLQPGEVEESGSLLLLEHRSRLKREQGVRETFEFVISF
ncbi:hypothetical protein NI389_13850 [Pseudoalteromonas xiamenensis]|uniref:hypothetical protein n=1 Tax=Pseudoalteromonas xiamenensis TaxID=882626 RepID=UPI0027E51537|nr:hypothetical protein [Pseudoalteromonas xiamenensis]WMN59284.1 hypothetical protein NI389_13850 [Pseudoalteromonas xiamenensis]